MAQPQTETTCSSKLSLDGLTDSQCEVVGKFASVLRVLGTSDAQRELDDFWTAWSHMVPAVARAEVESLVADAVSLTRSHADRVTAANGEEHT